jgi:hypothetical protein
VAPRIGDPFFFHTYPGFVPPPEIVEVKSTVVPLQTGFALAEILIVAVVAGLTVIELEVAGDPMTHAAFDVMVTFTTSPAIRVELE